MNHTNYILTCSSTVDLPKEFLEQHNLPYVCFHFEVDGQEYTDDLGQSMPFQEFYQKIKKGASPKTSQVNVDEFEAFFEPYLQAGQDVIHIAFSSGLSGSCQSALIAKDNLQGKYPQRTIAIVDGLGASSGYGLLVALAAEQRDQGLSLEELVNWVEEIKLKINHWFFSVDLMHYKRGGRISPSMAVIGTMLGVCPLLDMDSAGKLNKVRNVRGKKKVIQEIVQEMKNHAENRKEYAGKCFISQSDCMEDALEVADLITDYFPNIQKPIMINNIGTVIGSHTGPGTVALFFVGDTRK